MNRLKYIASGVRTDVEKLLNKFVDNGNINFQEFSKIWREMKFSLIFMGRRIKNELLEFTEECFRIVLSYLDNKNSFEMQVGSIFFLYGLYIKQPDSREKIRVRTEDWRNLKELVKKCEEKDMKDILYIFHYLCDKNAFHFVYKANLYGPRTSVVCNDVLGTEKHWDKVSYDLKQLLAKNELPQIASLHEKYQETKKGLPPSLARTLNLVQDNVARKAVITIKKLLASKQMSISDVIEESDKNSNDDESDYSPGVGSSLGARRAVLKDKMFRSKPTTSRSRRHRMVVSDESDMSPQKKKAKKTLGLQTLAHL